MTNLRPSHIERERFNRVRRKPGNSRIGRPVTLAEVERQLLNKRKARSLNPEE